MEIMKQNYYLGLDMGTNSIGWAVTNEKYELLKARGKDLWGIREFDEAQTAVERRTHRISRRRRQREVVRIGLLKDYFHDAIMEVDPLFYERLENSKYHEEDKKESVRNKNSIFNDDDYTDTDYYRTYPTIFHLRKELLENESPHDVRLVYLALLNMFKHRGHFLNNSLGSDGNERKIKDAYKDFVSLIMDMQDEEDRVTFPQEIAYSKIEEILSNKDYSRTRKAEELAKLFGFEKAKKREIAFVKAICGLKVDAKILFKDLESDEKVDICFSDFGYEEKTEEILAAVGEENFQIVESMKEIFDIGSLAGILKGYTYLSSARVSEYEKHGKDLAILKDVMKKYASKDQYVELFRSELGGSYSAYVNSYNSGKKQRRNMKERKQEALYKRIKGYLKEFPQEDENIIYILNEIDKETFLPKQLTAANGVIPNQVHLREMKKILENAERYLPFLTEKDESNLTVSERIIRLFSFQIPYYVGPVSERSKNGWVQRKEEGQVLPWNIEEKIDMKKTSEKFISNLVRRCTYISGERVLPKGSLEYESFCVLNEINNLKINGEKISVELKQKIYCQLFQQGKKVTKKKLVNFLKCEGALEKEEQLSGIDIMINNSLASYGRFKAVFGDKIEEDNYRKMAEDIIFWCTVYGDSKEFLKERIEEQYAEKLSKEELKRILGFKFKDWGNLSKEFLELPGCDKSTGEVRSLIRTMWETNNNLMELLHSDEFTFKEELAVKQGTAIKVLSEFSPEDLEEYYFSAPVKRMIWQTTLIIRELEKVLGAPPKRLFVEMTRSEGEKGDKGRTDSRKKHFLELYKKIQDESHDWKKVIEDADEDGRLRSKKMYLYLTQRGRCMYSGEPIELEDLLNNTAYDIDHIYPRSIVKDDNIGNNLVLVKKELNAKKSDNYPLDKTLAITPSLIGFWKSLLNSKLISEEKYYRLIGKKSFTEEQKADFIARQLVETSQGTKGVADLLGQMLPETEIVYSKASNVSEFRKTRGLLKSRLVNDFHHAHDAYLNIVVGNVYYVKFTKNPLNFIKKEFAKDTEKNRYNLSKMFDWNVVRGEEVAWIAEKGSTEETGTIVTVKKMLAKNTPLMTRLSFEGHGGLADQTLYGACKANPEKYIPLKQSDERMKDVLKYGGFSSVSTAYFFLVEHEVKGKKVRTLETVPVYLKEKIAKNPGELLVYCKETLHLVNPSVRLKEIKLQSLIKRNGYYMYISGKTGNQITLRNAVNLCLKRNWIEYIKAIEKYSDKGIKNDIMTYEKNIDLYEVLMDKHKNSIYQKRPNPVGEKLEDGFELFKTLKLEEQCTVLRQILNLSIIGVTSADLSLIGAASKSGVMIMSKKIGNDKEMKLINQSVTGLYESSIDLLTI